MFGSKARRIRGLEAKNSGLQIDLRAVAKARADAERQYAELRGAQSALVEKVTKAAEREASLTAERDQLSTRVEELENQLGEAEAEIEERKHIAPEQPPQPKEESLRTDSYNPDPLKPKDPGW